MGEMPGAIACSEFLEPILRKSKTERNKRSKLEEQNGKQSMRKREPH